MSDQRMMLEHAHGFRDQFDRVHRRRRIVLEKEIRQSHQIGKGCLRVDQLRQDFAFGCLADLPAALARM